MGMIVIVGSRDDFAPANPMRESSSPALRAVREVSVDFIVELNLSECEASAAAKSLRGLDLLSLGHQVFHE
jgi:hypothetical protein